MPSTSARIEHSPGFWVGWGVHCRIHHWGKRDGFRGISPQKLCMASDLTQLRERAADRLTPVVQLLSPQWHRQMARFELDQARRRLVEGRLDRAAVAIARARLWRQQAVSARRAPPPDSDGTSLAGLSRPVPFKPLRGAAALLAHCEAEAKTVLALYEPSRHSARAPLALLTS